MNRRVTVDYCIALAREYYADHPSGGSLHIVLDDGNIARSHVKFCLDYAKEKADLEGVELASALLELTDEQVAQVYMRLWPKRRRILEDDEPPGIPP